MTSSENDQNFGPPAPITKLTLEQDLKLRNIYDALNRPDVKKEQIVDTFMALQKQNFILANSLINLVHKWPIPTDLNITNEELPMFGILLESKD